MLLIVFAAVLLMAPTLGVVAAFTLAGPSTRALLAGTVLAEQQGTVAASGPASDGIAPPNEAGGGPVRWVFATTQASDANAALPIFEPRLGRFVGTGTGEPDDVAGHHHDGDDVLNGVDGRGTVVDGQVAPPTRAPGLAPDRPAAVPVATPWPAGPPRPFADLPILMFHYTGPLPPNPDVFRRDLTVSPALLEGQLKYLADNGVETVSLGRLFEHLAGRQPLPAKAVVLTFDDGYADNYEFAFQLLKKYGMVGTFFIPTGLVGRPNYMTWEQIEEMDAAGMSMEAHSITHADFTKIGPAQLARELAEPKRLLEEHLGHPCRFVAYPGGRFDPAVIRAVSASGYTAAVSTQHGTRHTAAGPFELTRVRVRGTESVEQLAAKLTPASWRTLARQP